MNGGVGVCGGGCLVGWLVVYLVGCLVGWMGSWMGDVTDSALSLLLKSRPLALSSSTRCFDFSETFAHFVFPSLIFLLNFQSSNFLFGTKGRGNEKDA